MVSRRYVNFSFWAFTFLLALSIAPIHFAYALNEAPRTFTLDGRIFSTPTSSTPLLGDVVINIKILNPAGTCVLYEEAQSYDTTLTDGNFNIAVGSATGSVKRTGDDPNLTMETIYQNRNLIAATNATCPGGYTPVAGHNRMVRITVTPVATGIAQVFTPDLRLDSIPTAVVAESVQGLSRDNMLELNTNIEMTQANFENVFGVINYPKLTALLSGTSADYMKAAPAAAVSFNSQRITNVASPTSGTDAVNRNYSDGYIGGKTADAAVLSAIGAGDSGKVMVWDGGKWTASAPAGDSSKLPLAGGTMTGALTMGGQNILAAGHITMSSQATLNLGTYTNAQETVLVLGLGAPDKGKFWYNTDASALKVWNGTSAVVVQLSGATAGGDLTGTYPSPSIAAGAVTTPHLFANPGINRIVMTDGATGASLAAKSCALGKLLKWTATGWDCADDDTASGTVTSIATGTGLSGGPISGTGTIGIAAGGVSATELASNAIVNSKINDDAVTSSEILDGAILAADLNSIITNGFWSVNGSDVYRAAGNVGIGITAPSSELDVSGTIRSQGTSGGVRVGLTLLNSSGSSAGRGTSVQFTGGSNVTMGQLQSVWQDAGNNAYLSIFTRDAGSVSEKIRISPTGGVGIGTTSPANELSIVETGLLAAVVMNQMSWGASASTGVLGVDGSLSNELRIGSQSNHGLELITANSIRLYISNSGEVGIGTTSAPNSLLTVAGVTSFAETVTPANTANYGKLYVKSADSKLYFMDDAGTETDLLTKSGGVAASVAAGTGTAGAPSISFSGDPDTGFYNSTSSNTISIAAGAANIFNLSSSGLVSPTTGGGLVTTANGLVGAPTYSFAGDPDTGWWRPAANTMAASTGGSERLRLTSAGYLGVGTNAPVEALDVNGGIKLGTTVGTSAGTLRWTGTNFQGFDGASWFNILPNPVAAGACDQTVTFSAAGVSTYTVPAAFATITIQAWGGGGSGGNNGSNGMSGSATTISSLGLSAGGGSFGGQGSWSIGSQGGPGNGGTASGGTVNTSGNPGTAQSGANTGAGGSAPSGGSGGLSIGSAGNGNAGATPGGGGSGGNGGSTWIGAGGGSGAYLSKSFTVATLPPGTVINDIVVGAGGTGSGGNMGGAGGSGQVSITCSTTGTPPANERGILFLDSGAYSTSTTFVYNSSGNVGIGTTDPTSTLTLNGSLARNVVTVTSATHTVLATETHIIANNAGVVTITLPSAAAFPGREISIRTITANTVVSDANNVVPLAGGAASTAILSATAGKWALLVSDGTNWQIQMAN